MTEHIFKNHHLSKYEKLKTCFHIHIPDFNYCHGARYRDITKFDSEWAMLDIFDRCIQFVHPNSQTGLFTGKHKTRKGLIERVKRNKEPDVPEQEQNLQGLGRDLPP